MLVAQFIFVDDDYDTPLYSVPEDGTELEPEVWEGICEVAHDAFDSEIGANGSKALGEHLLAWRLLSKFGLTFVVVVEEGLSSGEIEGYLKALSQSYLDEVDDPRRPDKDGVADVVIDVIPPWDEL